MTHTPALTPLNRFIYDIMWFVPLFCIGTPLFIYCVIQIAYWLCFGRRKPQSAEIWASNQDIIHFDVGPCLSSSDIAEIEAEQVKEEIETWSL